MKKETKKLKEFKKICHDIKTIKIQGASNIAKTALKAYSLIPTKSSIKKLSSLRPTEPMLFHVLKLIEKIPKKKILEHFSSAQEKINKFVFKLIKNKDTIFTHCHSTNVIKALIYAKKHGKRFEIFNTETRPLYQGRKTARALARAGIRVTTVVDAAAAIAIEQTPILKKVDKVFFGSDAILRNSNVINKTGSGMFAEIAFFHKIPVYIIADSWKFSSRPVKIEERAHFEIWKKAPTHVKIKNPAFEIVKAKYIKAIISELGILKPKEFVKKVMKK